MVAAMVAALLGVMIVSQGASAVPVNSGSGKGNAWVGLGGLLEVLGMGEGGQDGPGGKPGAGERIRDMMVKVQLAGLEKEYRDGFESLVRAVAEEEEAMALEAARSAPSAGSPPATGHRQAQGRASEPSAPPKNTSGSLPGPYYSFIPEFKGRAVPGNPPTASWSTPCFSGCDASSSPQDAKGATEVSIRCTGAAPTPPGHILPTVCVDTYLVASVTGWKVLRVGKEGVTKLPWGGKGEDMGDLAAYGARVFRFPASLSSAVEAVWQTVELFRGPLSGAGVSKGDADRNAAFLRDYAHCDMSPREHADFPMDEADIQSGDAFGIVRLDGLDPLIMWGTGSRIGHTAAALRSQDGQLYVVESQDHTSYWPVGRVQKTPFNEWVRLASLADYNVAWMPLSRKARDRFNETAAREAFAGWEGLQYGFYNVLWGWIDTPTGNFPWPLHPQLLMVALGILEPLLAKTRKPSFVNAAFGQRLGVSVEELGGLTTRGAYALARKAGVTFEKLITMPERDSWAYPNQTPSGGPGPAMVCNVFVCRLWKAAGLFDPLFDCSEFTPLDTYQLTALAGPGDAAAMPPACRAGNPPGSPLCQFLGKYSMSIPTVGTVEPFAGMREGCPSTPPDYEDRVKAAGWC